MDECKLSSCFYSFYGEYTVDVTEQQYDDARSTYKSAKETKEKKGR